MAYKADEYTTAPVQPAGTIEETEVLVVDEGTMGQFITNWEKFAKDGSKVKKSDPALEVTLKNGVIVTLSLPRDGSKTVHAKSNMGRWQTTYGGFPKVGQKVKTIVNAEGFKDVVLA